MDQQLQPKKEIKIKVTDEVLAGKYANIMQTAHTKEEFILDFMNVVPPQGILNARVITSPGHMKRIVKALQENIVKYEEKFGSIDEAEAPKGIPFPKL
jgi:uncharacterized protein DUF3467